MKKTIFSSIYKGYLVITISLAIFITLAIFYTLKNNYLSNLKIELIKNTELLAEIFSPIIKENNRFELAAKVKSMAQRAQVRITIIDPEGRVEYDSVKSPSEMENHATRIEVMKAVKGEIGYAHHLSETLSKDMLYVALPIKTNNQLKKILRTSVFVKDINLVLKPLYWQVLFYSVLLLLFALGLASILAKKISAPFSELESAAQRIAQGDFSGRILLKDSAEAKKLADGFNIMSEKLNKLVRELKEQKDELEVIIESIQEGLLVIDAKSKIKLTNKSFNRLFSFIDTPKKYYWEVLREQNLGELIKKAQQTEKNMNEDLTIQDKNYLVSTARLSDQRGLALFFRDITEFKQLEKVKKDFVVNASHELRTPLTAIKGFVETLDDEIKDEQHKHYLRIINNHTERLINIVQDIMLLSELEEKNNSLKLEKVDLKKIIEEVKTIFEPKINEKKLDFKIIGNAEIVADTFKLQQVFINLLDNAVKYTEKGGITILLEKQQDNVVISVQDTGLGIPEADLPRIFERFYVVDKSRTRKLGGTGLGLSIVKHIISLHKGKISIESEINKGSTFIIILPIIRPLNH